MCLYMASYMEESGVKGPTWLSCLKHFDLVKGMTPEYMHAALLGVSKLVLTMWMSDARSHGRFSDLHDNISRVEERIRQIEVPSEIRRRPRRISEVKHWKGAHDN